MLEKINQIYQKIITTPYLVLKSSVVILLILFVGLLLMRSKEKKEAIAYRNKVQTEQSALLAKLKQDSLEAQAKIDSATTIIDIQTKRANSLEGQLRIQRKSYDSTKSNIKDLLAQHKDAKAKQDTVTLLANCDSLAQEAELAIAKVDRIQYTYDSSVHVYKSIIDNSNTIIAQKQRIIDDTKQALATSLNQTKDALNQNVKNARKLKRAKVLNKILLGVAGAGLIFALGSAH